MPRIKVRWRKRYIQRKQEGSLIQPIDNGMEVQRRGGLTTAAITAFILTNAPLVEQFFNKVVNSPFAGMPMSEKVRLLKEYWSDLKFGSKK